MQPSPSGSDSHCLTLEASCINANSTEDIKQVASSALPAYRRRPHAIRSPISSFSSVASTCFLRPSLKDALNLQAYGFVREVEDFKDCSASAPLPVPREGRAFGHASDPQFSHISLPSATASTLREVHAPCQTEALREVDDSSCGTLEWEASIHSAALPAESTNAIVVSPKLPQGMARTRWSVQDFELLRQVHRG